MEKPSGGVLPAVEGHTLGTRYKYTTDEGPSLKTQVYNVLRNKMLSLIFIKIDTNYIK